MIRLYNIVHSKTISLIEAYDDISMDQIRKMKNFKDYTDYDDSKVEGDIGYIHIQRNDPEWLIWGDVKAFDIKDGTEIANASYGKQYKTDKLKASIDVRSDFRRKGIATQIYNWIEELTHERLYPDTPHSPSAEKFWLNRMKDIK